MSESEMNKNGCCNDGVRHVMDHSLSKGYVFHMHGHMLHWQRSQASAYVMIETYTCEF